MRAQARELWPKSPIAIPVVRAALDSDRTPIRTLSQEPQQIRKIVCPSAGAGSSKIAAAQGVDEIGAGHDDPPFRRRGTVAFTPTCGRLSRAAPPPGVPARSMCARLARAKPARPGCRLRGAPARTGNSALAASFRPKNSQLLLGLHPLGGGYQTETAAERDHRAGDRDGIPAPDDAQASSAVGPADQEGGNQRAVATARGCRCC